EREVVDVTEQPVLTGFERLDDRMARLVKVPGCLRHRGVVAAAYVTAFHATAEVHPAGAVAQTFHASVAARSDVGDLIEVCAGIGHGASLAKSSSRRPHAGPTTSSGAG